MVEPKVGMRVVWKTDKNELGTVTQIDGSMYLVRWDDGTERGWCDKRLAWKDGDIGPTDEQPKPPEPWVPKNGDRFVIRGRVEQVCALAGTVCAALDCCDDQVFWFASKILEPDTASAPPQAESKLVAMLTEHGSAHGYTEDPVATLERLIAGNAKLSAKAYADSELADTKGMLDAACKRLGEREVEHAAALRAVDRLTAELRDYKGRARYRQ